MSKVKICGLTRLCDIEYVNELKPDYVGFVFAKTRRGITREHAVTLRMSLNPEIQAVGVFVDEIPRIVGAYAEDGIIDMVQLHGKEDEGYIHNLRYHTGCDIIKAFSVRSEDDIRHACKSSADYILLDNGKGGTGQSFDWSLIKDIERPYFLAGGLHPGNVEEAAETLRPYALDISSGVERDGYKDRQKIETCIRRIRHV